MSLDNGKYARLALYGLPALKRQVDIDMQDQRHLIAQIDRLKASVPNPDNVHWQSVAVILTHTDNPACLERTLATEKYGMLRTVAGVQDYTRRSLYLSPKGMPYFVHYGDHDTLYNALFGVDQHDLNCAGWVHVSAGRAFQVCPLTRAQRKFFDTTPSSTDSEHCDWTMMSDDPAKTRVPHERCDLFDVAPSPEIDTVVRRAFRPRPILSPNYEGLSL